MRQGLIVLVAALTACASAAPPPGGAEDKVPPQLIRVAPDTNAVNVKDRYASFYFDETVNDRGSGAQEIDPHFLVSPSDGTPKVEWHRSRIDVRPRKGFKANTAYTITLLPGLTDLQNNAMKTGSVLVFSTGPTIPADRIKGIIFDWIAERPAANAYIEAMSQDSTVYLAQADTAGRFVVGPLNPGVYVVTGVMDANTNRALDRNEAFDSVRVTVPQTTALLELFAAPRDTLPVSLSTVAVTDSLALRITLDRAADPATPITAANFRLIAADSSIVPIVAVLSPLQERVADSIATKTVFDSTRRADSLAGKTMIPIPPPDTSAAARARVAAAPPKPSRATPFTLVTIKVGTPLKPNADYRLSATGLVSITGRTRPSERRFTTPKPAPPPAAKDSAAAKVPAALPATPPAGRPVTPPARR
ncbi:MAG: Ig-like domain-containing protein [Gemmatimonadaceae bacterium]